jgi:hypothetical protein
MRRRISSAKPGTPALPRRVARVSRGEWWSLGAGGLLADDLQDGGRAEVELVEEEVVGVDCLQPERCQRGGGKSVALAVMMPCAPPRIAAASTCRSS